MSFEPVLTTCPFCGTGCNFYLSVMGGRVVDVIPCETHPISEGRLCVLGRNAHRIVHHSDRLTRPLVKKGGAFSEVSWEEAVRTVAEGLKTCLSSHGPQALGVLASAKCTNEENYLIMKFARGGLGTNNIDHCARL